MLSQQQHVGGGSGAFLPPTHGPLLVPVVCGAVYLGQDELVPKLLRHLLNLGRDHLRGGGGWGALGLMLVLCEADDRGATDVTVSLGIPGRAPIWTQRKRRQHARAGHLVQWCA